MSGILPGTSAPRAGVGVHRGDGTLCHQNYAFLFLRAMVFCKKSTILNASGCDPKTQLALKVLSNSVLRSLIQIHLVLAIYLKRYFIAVITTSVVGSYLCKCKFEL